IGRFEGGLLRVTAEGIARLQGFVILDGRFVISLAEGCLGLGIQPAGGPILGSVDLFRQQGTAAEQQDQQQCGQDSKYVHGAGYPNVLQGGRALETAPEYTPMRVKVTREIETENQ